MDENTKRKYPRFAQDFSGESMTQQHFTDSCEITNIVETYAQTGIDPYAERKAKERFGDGTYRTYLDAMNTVAAFRSQFHELPLAIREQFNNDPEAYLHAQEQLLTSEPEPSSEPDQKAPEEPLNAPPEDASEGEN